MQIILASGSPRRKEILEQVGIPFSISISQKEEKITKSEPEDVVKELSYRKAKDASERIEDNGIIIGADTIVVQSDHILGKPKDKEHAVQMLCNLQGGCHSVYTGVSVLKKIEGRLEKEIIFSVETKVFIAAMTEDEILAYVETGEPMDKAGAYAIQGRFASYITKIDGDYYNVVGLPIAPLYAVLKEEGCIV